MLDNLEALILGVLVLITAYYAFQTRNTVTAMQASTRATLEATDRSIRAQQMPRLALQVYSHGETEAGVQITNVGGPAIDADLSIEFVPHTHRNLLGTVRRHRFSIIESPQQIMVAGPLKADGEEGQTIPRKELCQDYDRIVVRGNVTDSLGDHHEIEETIEDLRPFADDSSELITIDNPQHRSARLMNTRMFAMQTQLREIARALNRAYPPDEDDVPF